MKFFTSLLISLFFSIQAFAQIEQKYVLKAKPIISQVVTLHSLANLSRKPSRQIISFEMPPKTFRWYYSFTTIKSGMSFLDDLRLAVQIAKLVPTGPSTKAGIKAVGMFLDNINVPNGNLEINAYMLNYADGMNFMNKQPFLWMPNSEFKSTKSGKKELISLQPGFYFIGLENLSNLSAVDVKVEAVALVVEKVNQ